MILHTVSLVDRKVKCNPKRFVQGGINADEIVVVTPDGVEERGTHEELMQKNGLYKELYEYQFRNL